MSVDGPVRIRIRRGLDVPLAGVPEQRVHDAAPVGRVALVAADYRGLRPRLLVAEGDPVRLGQPLVEDRANPGVRLHSPGGGSVAAIHRGARRALRSVVVRLEPGAEEPAERFEPHDPGAIPGLGRDRVAAALLASGLWAALRTRPWGRVPAPGDAPRSIFVTAIDTNPLAADPRVAIGASPEDFVLGIAAIAALTDGPVWLCEAPGAALPAPDHPRVRRAEFAGPHPAGLPGTHIHFLDPVDAGRTVWHVGYQDAIAIGRLLVTGRLSTERVVALGGPVVERPRLLRTRLGASTEDLVHGEHDAVACRVIAGSVLSGRRAVGDAAFLGARDTQISILAEHRERELFGWLRPGWSKFSALPVFASGLLGRGRLALDTALNGSPRAMVPIGSYERVVPLDLLPTQLLRALVVRDTDTAQALGCLELEEEDLALCSFVCPGKYEYGPALRASLDLIEREG